MITLADLQKCEIKIGTVLTCEVVPDADKLLKLAVDIGLKPSTTLDDSSEHIEAQNAVEERDVRQIISGIRAWYAPEDLIGKQFLFATNLEPRILKGMISQGMILAAKQSDGSAVLLSPLSNVDAGSVVI